MFKELKVIKLLILGGLLFAFFLTLNVEKLGGLYVYSGQLSYFKNENVDFHFLTGENFTLSKDIKIKNVVHNEVVETFPVNIKNKPVDEQDVIKNGLGKGELIEKTTNSYSSGIYLVNETSAFVVKSEDSADVVVIYPAMNNVLYEPFKGKNAIGDKGVSRISLNRQASLDPATINWLSFFAELESKYKVNYITDLDLEKRGSLNAKVAFIYSDIPFWTKKMKDNFFAFQESGGNVLFSTTKVMNNAIWYDLSNNIISYSEDKSNHRYESWAEILGYYPTLEIGMSYSVGIDTPVSNTFEIIDKEHPIFKNIQNSVLEFELSRFTGYIVVSVKGNETLNLRYINYQSGKILAKAPKVKFDNKMTGIVELKKDSLSGTIISLGTSDWCYQKAFKNKKTMYKIALNAVEYLLK